MSRREKNIVRKSQEIWYKMEKRKLYKKMSPVFCLDYLCKLMTHQGKW